MKHVVDIDMAIDSVIRLVEGVGYTVKRNHAMASYGLIQYKSKVVQIRSHLPPEEELATLIHELVHALLHERESRVFFAIKRLLRGSPSKRRYEYVCRCLCAWIERKHENEAESVADSVCLSLGMDTSARGDADGPLVRTVASLIIQSVQQPGLFDSDTEN